MEKEHVYTNVSESFFWTFAERISAQLVSTIVGIILARLLTPNEYGIISIVMIFITICNVFVVSGFGTALVRKLDVDSLDFNTAFFLSFFSSLFFYILLFFSAPLIADFYQIELLSPVIRVLGIRLIVTSLNTIQQAKVQRDMAFRKFFISTLCGTVLSCVIGIAMAYKGCGVWALVTQYMVNTSTDTVILLFTCGWRPKLEFSLKRAVDIFKFGIKVLGADLIITCQTELRSFVVGKRFGTLELAYLDQGKKYVALFVNNINSSVNKVMLPTFAREQNNIGIMKARLRKSVQMLSFILMPILFGFFVVAPIFVEVILTSKWMDCVPYIQVFCIMYLTRPLSAVCNQALLAMNKSGLAMIIKIIINLCAIIGLFISVFVFKQAILVAWSLLISDFVSMFLYMVVIHKQLKYYVSEQIKDIWSPFVCSLIMTAVVKPIQFIDMNHKITLAVQVLIGIITYVLMSDVLKSRAYIVLKEAIMSFAAKFLKQKMQK